MNIDFEVLEEHIGEQYGRGDIAALMGAAIFNNNGSQKDHKGLICSEYLALCYKPICEYYNLPPYCITPAHFQNYIDKLGIRNEECKSVRNCVADIGGAVQTALQSAPAPQVNSFAVTPASQRSEE